MWRSAVGSKRPSPPPKEQPIAASRKKRKRPTRLRVKDDQALSALLQFGIYHRAAIADHLLKRFKDSDFAKQKAEPRVRAIKDRRNDFVELNKFLKGEPVAKVK